MTEIWSFKNQISPCAKTLFHKKKSKILTKSVENPKDNGNAFYTKFLHRDFFYFRYYLK